MDLYQVRVQAILHMKPAAIVTDTTGLKPDSDLLQVLIMELDGTISFQTLIAPGRYIGETNRQYTGISAEQLDTALPIYDVWPAIVKAIEGRYLLAYGDFVQERLDEHVRHYGLHPIYAVGNNLHDMAAEYLGRNAVSLATAYTLITGKTLPPYPRAEVRAAAMITILQAMAEGLLAGKERPF